MVFKLIGKLLLKATIPFVIIAGLLSYGMHSRGGDPVAMWQGFGGGVIKQIAVLFSDAKDDASQAVDAVANVTKVGTGALQATQNGSSKLTQVYTWKDAEGVTHYSTVAPIDTDSKTMSINPDMNVLEPVIVPEPVKVSRRESSERSDEPQTALLPRVTRDKRQQNAQQGYADPAVQDIADQLGGELPGVVGQILSTQDGTQLQGLNPAQLLKMLQQ